MNNDNCINKKKIDGWNKVLIARKINRVHSLEIIENVFDTFLELHGDRFQGDDKSIVAGIAKLDNISVTVIGQQKGSTLKEMEIRNYGMTSPHGYRKALRLMRQADKFNRPIICFIDTPGAFPGVSAEKYGQAEAIARNLYEMASFKVPIISIILGEGGSGGALALGIANKVIMLENSIYSVVSPEGCASILFKDSKKAPEAASMLKLTARELKELGIVDLIVSEEGTETELYERIKELIKRLLKEYRLIDSGIREERINRFRNIGIEIAFSDTKEI